MQTVGVTDFTVKYSRPFIKGRKVFAAGAALALMIRSGGQVPTWLTTFEASTEFTFGGKKVPAGKYALFSIPNGAAWTVILNKNFDQGGSENYKESDEFS